jgi:hypothetical protein
MPQFEQKRAVSATSLPHSGHRRPCGLPQLAQNFAPGGFSNPQCGQAGAADMIILL